MAYSEAPHQWAWLIMRDHTRRRGLWWDNTPEGMANNEASHQKAWSIVRLHTSRHGWKWDTIHAGMANRDTQHQQACRNQWEKIGRHTDWVVKDRQVYWLSSNGPESTHLAHHSTSRHVWTAVVFVEVKLGQNTYLLQLQRHSNGVSLDQQACILLDNVAIVLPTKVSQFKLACLVEGHQSRSFSLWFSKETCLIEWYQVLRHICWSFIERHPCIATRPSHDILTSMHANYVVLKQHTCMPVAETQDLQACVFVTSHQQ